MDSIRGVVYGHVSAKILKFKKSHSAHHSEFQIPHTFDSQKILEFNAMIPIYCIKIVLKERDLDLVFQSFKEIKELISTYFLPMKQLQWEKKRLFISVPTVGKILWVKFKYVLRWKLGNSGLVSKEMMQKRMSFCKLILLSKHNTKIPNLNS